MSENNRQSRVAKLAQTGGFQVREVKLGEQLYRYLIDLIDSGKLMDGAKLPTEKQLCESFRISRPVVREALARLRMERRISSRRGSGSFVIGGERTALGTTPALLHTAHAALAKREFHEAPLATAAGSRMANLQRCLELRLAIEPLAAQLAATRRSDAHLADLETAIAEIDAAINSRSLDHKAHYRFHLLVAQAADNPFLVASLQFMEQHIEVSMNIFRDLWLLEPGQSVSVGQHGHREILTTLRERWPEQARRAMQMHLEEAWRELFGAFPSPG